MCCGDNRLSQLGVYTSKLYWEKMFETMVITLGNYFGGTLFAGKPTLSISWNVFLTKYQLQRYVGCHGSDFDSLYTIF